MAKRIALLAVVLITVGLSSSVALALPPMGPPKALLGQDRWGVGVGVSHSQMDVDTFGKAREDQGAGWLPTSYAKHEIEDLTSNIVLGRVGYGAYETIDVFVCLGASDAQDDMTEKLATGGDGNKYTGLDSSLGFAYGFGARATFWQEGDLAWGGLVQVLWENPSSGDVDLIPSDGDPAKLSGDMDLNLQEIQVAVGPTVRMGGFSVYGGPFLHVVSGDLDIDASGTDSFSALNQVDLSQDIRQDPQIGVFAGAMADADQDTSWYVEFQVTGDAWGIGIGGTRRF
ncbi:MAG: hypothetical protein P8Z79_24750 [Sedimentisphaerales bacterium]|jgi:hypothetical protein